MPSVPERSASAASCASRGAGLAAVNAAFRPTETEVAWAERVVAADVAAQGAAVAVDGRMVDRPVLLQARAILSEAGRTPAQLTAGLCRYA